MASKRNVDAAGPSEMDQLLEDKTDGIVQSENIPDHNDPSNNVAMEGNMEENVDPVIALMTRMEKLLKKMEENRTDKVIRVLRSDGQKVSCQMRVNIITIGNIDTVKEEFTCELALTVKWKEPKIRGKDADEINWREEWDPRICFYNALSIDKYKIKKRLAKESEKSDPIAQLSIRMKGVFKSAMKLNQFPFDYQDLKIRIMSDWPSKYIEFLKEESKEDKIRTDTFTGGQEWELQEHVKTDAVNKKDMPDEYPLYDIVVNVKRKASYYMWNVALIMVISQVLIISLAFISYFVGSDASEGRMSVTVVLLLTTLAFKYSVSQSLPNISYQTLLDYYVLVCIGCTCMFIFWNALAPLVPKECELPTLCVLGGLTVLINFIFIVIACWKSPMSEMSIQDERTPLAC